MSFRNSREMSDHQLSPVMQNIMQTIEPIAISGLGILIVGEQGTEKEWLANMIHRLSGRTDHKFIKLDCRKFSSETVPKKIFGSEELTFTGKEIHRGVFEEAAGGTIFFDNVSELSLELQIKISRVQEHHLFQRVGGLEEIRANVRIVGALNKRSVEDKTEPNLRKDIYRQLWPITINLPPLRERREDIPLLAEAFMRQSRETDLNLPKHISADVMRIFLLYDWPENADELQYVIEYVMLMCPDQNIRMRHLPRYMQKRSLKQDMITVQGVVN